MPCLCMKSFEKALEASSCAARLLGPNAGIPPATLREGYRQSLLLSARLSKPAEMHTSPESFHDAVYERLFRPNNSKPNLKEAINKCKSECAYDVPTKHQFHHTSFACAKRTRESKSFSEMLTLLIFPLLAVPPLPENCSTSLSGHEIFKSDGDRVYTPGATKTFSTTGDSERRQASACSRPPDPTTSTLPTEFPAKG